MTDDFSKRLESAIERGKQTAEDRANSQRATQQSDERLREMHTRYRLQLCDFIEDTLRKLADHLPGFRFESVYDEGGLGSACYRENLKFDSGRRTTQFSRLEIVVRPCSDLLVLDIKGKAMIDSREIFNRSHYAELASIDYPDFEKCVEAWSLHYAEALAAKG